MYRRQKNMVYLLFIMLLFLPFSVRASNSSGSIQLAESDVATGEMMKGVTLTIYQVCTGNYAAGETLKLTEGFQEAEISVSKLTEESLLSKNAETLNQYIIQKKLRGIDTKTTGEDGIVTFQDLSDGLYLIRQTDLNSESDASDETFHTEPVLILIPWIQEDGSTIRDVICQPKGEKTGEEVTEASSAETETETSTAEKKTASHSGSTGSSSDTSSSGSAKTGDRQMMGWGLLMIAAGFLCGGLVSCKKKK